MKVQVAPDFRDLFRTLTEDEFEQAKANNLADPKHERIPPVVVWNGFIVDGHHTHRIRESLRVDGKPVKIRYHKMDFTDRESAMIYAIQAQLGRRNLAPSQIAIALAKLPKSKPGPKTKDELPVNLRETPSREELAAEHGISDKTLWFADKVNEHGAKAINKAVVDKVVTVSDAAAIADLTKKEQIAALKKVTGGESKTLKSAAAGKQQGKANGKPPKQYPRSHWLKQWESSIGPMVRLVDKIASEVGESKSSSHQSVQKQLNAATDKMHEWMGKK